MGHSPNLSHIVGFPALISAISAFSLSRSTLVIARLASLGFAYAAIVGFSVAAAAWPSLSSISTRLFGKCSDGYLPPWSYALWWPYHIALRVKLLVGRLVSKEPLYSKITPGWYLGGWPMWGARDLPPGRPTVVDVTCELPRSHSIGGKYMAVPVWDTRAPTLLQLDQAVEFCLCEAAEGRPLLIHCAHGHGRSATVMAACFLENGMAGTIDEALSLMKGTRPKVNLSHTQRLALEHWLEARRRQGKESRQQAP